MIIDVDFDLELFSIRALEMEKNLKLEYQKMKFF